MTSSEPDARHYLSAVCPTITSDFPSDLLLQLVAVLDENCMLDNARAAEAHQRGLISAGRLSEALLADHVETREISVLYGRAINNGA